MTELSYKKIFAISILALLLSLVAYSASANIIPGTNLTNITNYFNGTNVTNNFNLFTFNLSGQPALLNYTTLICLGNVTCIQDNTLHTISINVSGVQSPYFDKIYVNDIISNTSNPINISDNIRLNKTIYQIYSRYSTNSITSVDNNLAGGYWSIVSGANGIAFISTGEIQITLPSTAITPLNYVCFDSVANDIFYNSNPCKSISDDDTAYVTWGLFKAAVNNNESDPYWTNGTINKTIAPYAVAYGNLTGVPTDFKNSTAGNIGNLTSGNLTYNSTSNKFDLNFTQCTGNNFYQSSDGKNLSCIAPSASGVTTQSYTLKSVGTIYQNINNTAIFVSVDLQTTAVNGDAAAYTDSSNPPTHRVVINTASANFNRQLFFIVLPNNYYKVTAPATVTLLDWTEWR